jgi:hypothetical protein
MVRAAEKQAERASSWIWTKREENWQQRPNLLTDKEEEANKKQRAEVQQTQKPQSQTETSVPITSPTRKSSRHGTQKQTKRTIHRALGACSTNRVDNDDTHFFFGFKMAFSNFHRCTYKVQLPYPYGMKQMHSVEQLYMFRKAYYFNDHARCKKILVSAHARIAKQLGSQVKNFNRKLWKLPKREVMMECLVRKFTDSQQREALSKILLESKPILVEASPSDTEWGIGFSLEQAPNKPKHEWKGENVLGMMLMWLRGYLKSRTTGIQIDDHGFHSIYQKVHSKHMFTYRRQTYTGQQANEKQTFVMALPLLQSEYDKVMSTSETDDGTASQV